MAIKFGVSFYSYQAAHAAGKMTTEDCIKALAAIPGADGVEILEARTPRPPVTYPHPTEKELDAWRALMAEHGVKPVAYDSEIRGKEFLKYMTNPDKATYDDQMARMKDEIDFASAIGCTVMRSPNLFGFYAEVMEDSLGYAEAKNVSLCMEIHNPLMIKGPFVGKYVEMIERTGTKFAGLIPDLGIFSKSVPLPGIEKALRDGGEEKLIREIVAAYEAGEDMEKFAVSVRAKTENAATLAVLDYTTRYVRNDPEDLRLIAKHIQHVHGKFYHMDENCVENGIDNAAVYRVLKDIGFDGYICSEFEGQRYYEAENMVDEVEQVRRHHVEMHRCLD